MLKTLSVSALLVMATVDASFAGFENWTVEKKSDPFSGGESVSVNFLSTIRSGVFISCESSTPGLTVRSVPGFDYDSALDAFKPTIKFAFDGKLLFTVSGNTGKSGNNLAYSDASLLGYRAQDFAKAFASAKKQVAIDDGISEKPQLLSASGSTAAGAALVDCIQAQSGQK